MGKIRTATHKKTPITLVVLEEGKLVACTDGNQMWAPRGYAHVLAGVNDKEYIIDPKTLLKSFHLDRETLEDIKQTNDWSDDEIEAILNE